MFFTRTFRTFLPLLLLALVGCGGDSDERPVDRPGVFTSANAQNVPENSVGVIYTATARQGNNGPLTFSVAGGAAPARNYEPGPTNDC